MKTYRVYFSDGNQKLYGSDDIKEVIEYIDKKVTDYKTSDIIKIEEAPEY